VELEEEVLRGARRRVVLRLPVVVEEVDVLRGRPVDAAPAHPVEQREVVAVAAGVIRVVEVPERLVARERIVRVDVREGQPADVLRALLRVLVDGRLVLVERQVLAVPLRRLVEPVVPLPARVREVDELVAVVALLEVVVDLGRQQILHLVHVARVDHRPGLHGLRRRRETDEKPQRQSCHAITHR
jgi:hypothetical protein